MDPNTVLFAGLVLAGVVALALIFKDKLRAATHAQPGSPPAPPAEKTPHQRRVEGFQKRLDRAIGRSEIADLQLDAVGEEERARAREREADVRERQMYGHVVPDDGLTSERPRDEARRDQGDDRRTRDRDTTTGRQPEMRTITINGERVRQGQNRVYVPNGHVTLEPIPGPRGYNDGTQVTFVANPTIAGSTVRWQGAGVQGPFRAIVTMNADKQVQVTITPPTTGTSANPANPAGTLIIPPAPAGPTGLLP